MKTAFLCLGVMGYPMAGHLLRGGHEVTVYNRTRSRKRRPGLPSGAAERAGVRAERRPRLARDAEFVFTCVGNDNDVREIGDARADSERSLAGMAEGACLDRSHHHVRRPSRAS